MELREFAERILLTPTVDDKLADPGELVDLEPGRAQRLALPARPPRLQFEHPRRHGPRMPKGFHEPRLRALAHHIMANHELQALEVMAWVVLAFPEAPAEFRRGLGAIMIEEQRHTAMHLRRLKALGYSFGEWTVNGHVWIRSQSYRCLLDYLAGLPLTLEGANLDHSLAFAQRFAEVGDRASAAVMRAIHRDEIKHVAFGIAWLRRLKAPGESDWDCYRRHLSLPARPEHAIGVPFLRQPRLAAGLTEAFVDELEAVGRSVARIR